jgi:16S rRNA (cytosine967-C5)-methyltransferase
MQLDLLNNAWPLLKPQGKLLYVTCSIFKEENEDVILKFCDNRQDVKRGGLKFPKIIHHLKNQLVPSKNHDGLYYEILEKK